VANIEVLCGSRRELVEVPTGMVACDAGVIVDGSRRASIRTVRTSTP